MGGQTAGTENDVAATMRVQTYVAGILNAVLSTGLGEVGREGEGFVERNEWVERSKKFKS